MMWTSMAAFFASAILFHLKEKCNIGLCYRKTASTSRPDMRILETESRSNYTLKT